MKAVDFELLKMLVACSGTKEVAEWDKAYTSLEETRMSSEKDYSLLSWERQQDIADKLAEQEEYWGKRLFFATQTLKNKYIQLEKAKGAAYVRTNLPRFDKSLLSKEGYCLEYMLQLCKDL